jgi:glycosyltransferase involved in cell wall biosynthesis
MQTVAFEGSRMVRILVPSASHLLTDHLLSSEGIFCYNVFQHSQRFHHTFDAISPQVHIQHPLRNATLHQVGSFVISPTLPIYTKYLSHLEFLINSYRKSQEILRNHQVDIIHHMLPAVYEQTFSLLALLGKTRRYPFVLGPLSAHIYSLPVDEQLLSMVTSSLHRQTIQHCDRVITINNHTRKLYAKYFTEDQLWTIPFGVDTHRFTPMKNPIKKDGHEILFVGYLYHLKGTEYLIKAMRQIVQENKNTKLRIVGDGPDKHRLMRLTQALHIADNVIFEGEVSHTDMPRYYQQCDVFCFPTLGEPFGKVIIEAMACAKPVVASQIGGPREIIEHEKNGILIPPAQPQLLAHEILALLRDEKRRQRIGNNAREHVQHTYSWKLVTKKIDQLYCSLM